MSTNFFSSALVSIHFGDIDVYCITSNNLCTVLYSESLQNLHLKDVHHRIVRGTSTLTNRRDPIQGSSNRQFLTKGLHNRHSTHVGIWLYKEKNTLPFDYLACRGYGILGGKINPLRKGINKWSPKEKIFKIIHLPYQTLDLQCLPSMAYLPYVW
jgi:hypothetical protein